MSLDNLTSQTRDPEVEKINRIQYLTYKAQHNAISDPERNELAQLLGREPSKFQGSDGLSLLIAFALGAITSATLISLLSGGNK